MSLCVPGTQILPMLSRLFDQGDWHNVSEQYTVLFALPFVATAVACQTTHVLSVLQAEGNRLAPIMKMI